MSFVSDLAHEGYKPFRDHTQGQKIDNRNVMYGLLIKDIDNKDSVFKTGDRGDLQFAHFYKNRLGKREVGSWSFATPSLWLDKKTAPIFNKDFKKDDRYEEAETSSWLGRDYPVETPGIALAVSKEYNEEKIFFSSMGDLVAHHRGASPPKYSTIVFDIDSQGKVDKERKAGLHSAFWVQKLAPKLGALAWNLTKSSGDMTGWGLYKASSYSTGGTVERGSSPPSLMAFASWEMGGPWHPGAPGCGNNSHQRMITPDGVVNAGHIWTNALFFMNPKLDGPLDFEREPHPVTNDGGIPQQVHLRFDDKNQRWRWHVKVPFIFLEPPEPPGPPGPPEPPRGPGDPKRPPRGPGDPSVPGYPKPPTGGPDDSNPVFPKDWGKLGPKKWDPAPKKRKKKKKGSTLVFPWKLFAPGQGIIATPARKVTPVERHESPKDFIKDLSSLVPVDIEGLPGTGYMPRRFLDTPQRAHEDPELFKRVMKEFPVVFQWEGFGRELIPGKIDKARDYFAEGSKSPDDFYPQGTGPGGLLISPPQIGMRDYSNGFSPKWLKFATPTGILFLDAGKAQGNTYLAWGEPDLDTGLPKNGWQFRTFLGDLQLRGLDSSGNTDLTKVVDFQSAVKHSGTWQYQSGAVANYIWASDASGYGSWVSPSSLGLSLWSRSGTTTYLTNTGDQLSIGSSSVATNAKATIYHNDVTKNISLLLETGISQSDISLKSRDGGFPFSEGGFHIESLGVTATSQVYELNFYSENGTFDFSSAHRMMRLYSNENVLPYGGGYLEINPDNLAGGVDLYLSNTGSTRGRYFSAYATSEKIEVAPKNHSGVALDLISGDIRVYNGTTLWTAFKTDNVSRYVHIGGGGVLSTSHVAQIFGDTAKGSAIMNASPGFNNTVLTITNNDVGTGGLGDYVWFRDSAGNIYFNFNNSNNCSIGAAFPAGGYRLDVSGACHASSFPVSSDRRLKDFLTEIRPIFAMNVIRNLKAYKFKWSDTYKSIGRLPKYENKHSDFEVGLIADDVEEVCPELVSRWKGKNGVSYRALDYSRLVALCVSAINELDRKIKILEAKI